MRHGWLRRSRYGLICRGFGVASRSSQGEARYHMEGCGEIWRLGFGAFRFGSVSRSRHGTAWSGWVGYGAVRRSWQRAIRHGLAGKAGRSRFVSSG